MEQQQKLWIVPQCQWSASLARSNPGCRKAVFSFQQQEADKDSSKEVVTKTGHIDFQVKNGPRRHLSFWSLTSFLPQSSKKLLHQSKLSKSELTPHMKANTPAEQNLQTAFDVSQAHHLLSWARQDGQVVKASWWGKDYCRDQVVVCTSVPLLGAFSLSGF